VGRLRVTSPRAVPRCRKTARRRREPGSPTPARVAVVEGTRRRAGLGIPSGDEVVDVGPLGAPAGINCRCNRLERLCLASVPGSPDLLEPDEPCGSWATTMQLPRRARAFDAQSGGLQKCARARLRRGVGRGAAHRACGQERVLVVIVAGSVDREPPLVGIAGVTQPAQAELVDVGEDTVDVGKAGAARTRTSTSWGQHSRARADSDSR